jgi:hypothetical protein
MEGLLSGVAPTGTEEEGPPADERSDPLLTRWLFLMTLG